MPFLVSQAVVVLVDIMLRLALYHEPYTREYEDGSNRLHTLEYGERYAGHRRHPRILWCMARGKEQVEA